MSFSAKDLMKESTDIGFAETSSQPQESASVSLDLLVAKRDDRKTKSGLNFLGQLTFISFDSSYPIGLIRCAQNT